MRLQEFNALKVWHQTHGRHPVEKAAWDGVLTLWLVGWVGGMAALVMRSDWAAGTCLGLLFLPGVYVALRRWLHRHQRLRCEWLSAVERR